MTTKTNHIDRYETRPARGGGFWVFDTKKIKAVNFKSVEDDAAKIVAKLNERNSISKRTRNEIAEASARIDAEAEAERNSVYRP